MAAPTSRPATVTAMATSSTHSASAVATAPPRRMLTASVTTSTTASGDSFIVKTGIMHASTSSGKAGGHVGVCHTTTSNVGVSSIHVNKDDDILLRFAHPATATVTGITTGTTTTVSVNHPDIKLKEGDFVTMTGASPAIYNTTLKHVKITGVSTPQRWNAPRNRHRSRRQSRLRIP